MITKSIAARLLREVEGLDFPPDRNSPALDVLVITLANRSISESHARRIIDRWLETQTKWPKPADLVVLAAEINPTPTSTSAKADRDCPECEGFGYQFVRKVGGVSGATRCSRGCGIPGYQKQPDAVSTEKLVEWYRSEQDGAIERRQAFIKRGSKVLKAPKVTDDQIAALRQRQDAARTVR